MPESKDLALQPVDLNQAPGSAYANREWQGIPTIERSANGRLWVAFYSGGSGEGPDNFILLIHSDDGGTSWSDPVLAIDPPGKVRAFDPCLWHDPQGRLWLFWAQSYGFYDGRCGVWATVCENPSNENITWAKPRRIANGIMMNKPTVLTTGEWLLPAAVWSTQKSDLNQLEDEEYSNVYRSIDQGETFTLFGKADVAGRSVDEHMIVEREDGSLWMLVRLKNGIGESVSYDRGKTWINPRKTDISGPDSRFFIRRLASGRLLLVNHVDFTGRNNLTAMLSEDDGRTWIGHLLLDDRNDVSYPDGVQDENGVIYVVYDRERYGDREILMATFTEEDIYQQEAVSAESKLRMLINKA